MIDRLTDVLESLLLLMDEETRHLRDSPFGSALPELAATKVRLVGQLDQMTAAYGRSAAGWDRALDDAQRTRLADLLARLEATSAANAAALERQIDAAWDLVKDWSMEDREALRSAVPKLALDAPLPGGGRLGDIAGQVLDIAHAGLAARARGNSMGDNETGFLDPLREVVRSGKVPAQVLLDRYHGEWAGDLSRVYAEASF